MSPENDQNASDVEAATSLPVGHPATDETTVSEKVPGPAATSVDPTVGATASTPPASPDTSGQSVAVTPVAPTDPSVPPFVNPDPDSGITEPPKLDSQGNVIPVVAPANQESPVSPQVVAQEEAQKEAEQPPTIAELAACANALRVGQGDNGGVKVAALLDRVAQKRIDNEEKELKDSEVGTTSPTVSA